MLLLELQEKNGINENQTSGEKGKYKILKKRIITKMSDAIENIRERWTKSK